LRFGVSACTTRGFGPVEFEVVGDLIVDLLEGMRRDPSDSAALEAATREQARAITRRFPIYPD